MIRILPYQEANITDTLWHHSNWFAKPISQQVLRLALHVKAHAEECKLDVRVEGTNNPADAQGVALCTLNSASAASLGEAPLMQYVATDTDEHELVTPDLPVSGYAFFRVCYRFDQAAQPNSLGIDAILRDGECTPPLIGMSLLGQRAPERAGLVAGKDANGMAQSPFVDSEGTQRVIVRSEYARTFVMDLATPADGAWSAPMSVHMYNKNMLQLMLDYTANDNAQEASHLEAELSFVFVGNETVKFMIPDTANGDFRPSSGTGRFHTPDALATERVTAEYRIPHIAASYLEFRVRQVGATSTPGTYGMAVYTK